LWGVWRCRSGGAGRRSRCRPAWWRPGVSGRDGRDGSRRRVGDRPVQLRRQGRAERDRRRRLRDRSRLGIGLHDRAGGRRRVRDGRGRHRRGGLTDPCRRQRCGTGLRTRLRRPGGLGRKLDGGAASPSTSRPGKRCRGGHARRREPPAGSGHRRSRLRLVASSATAVRTLVANPGRVVPSPVLRRGAPRGTRWTRRPVEPRPVALLPGIVVATTGTGPVRVSLKADSFRWWWLGGEGLEVGEHAAHVVLRLRVRGDAAEAGDRGRPALYAASASGRSRRRSGRAAA